MALTVIQINATKPREKAYKLSDEGGLYLLINPNGSKLWKFKYRFAGKEKKLSFGDYPTLSLLNAREKRDQAKKLLFNGIDPGIDKKIKKRAKQLTAENSFENIAREWYA